MDRKKELKMQYKLMKSEMGIFAIRSQSNNKWLLQTTQDLKGRMNRTKVQLEAGVHPNRNLIKDWNTFSIDNFTIEILEKLEYDKDESKTDYSEELTLLQMLWEEKLLKDNIEFY